MEPSDYQRGVTAGEIESRLAGHDKHLARINGNLQDVATQLAALTMGIQRLADQAVARDATVITTADALKNAEDARRGASEERRATVEQQWSPKAKVMAVIGTVVAVASVVVAILLLISK